MARAHDGSTRSSRRRAVLQPPELNFVPGVDLFRVTLAAGRDAARGCTARIVRGAPPSLSEDVNSAWTRLVSLNPRLYNGPLLSVLSIDPDPIEFLCRRDCFARLVAQPALKTGVSLLAVSALITARDRAGREHVLLGRRGRSTRVYPGMWENGPAGGITPPPPNIDLITEEQMLTNLREEMEEEIGLVVEPSDLVALVRDTVAFSHDLVYRCEAPSVEEATMKLAGANWEYSETLWLPIDEVAAFDAANPHEIIPPTRAIFRVMGWVA